MGDDENSYEVVTPFPALPAHLNPLRDPSTSPDPCHRFSFYYIPSPLRNAVYPDASNGTHSNSSSSARDSPPSLDLDSCSLFPEKLQQTIDCVHECTAIVHEFANRGELTRKMRDIAHRHMGICITYIKNYAEALVDAAEEGEINQIVAESQWDVLRAEIRYLTNWRNDLLDIPVLD